MATDRINLKVYTPAGLVVDTQASYVTLPASDGDIGVLPHHARYIGLLGTGLLEYFEESGASRKMVISNGFCNFVNGTLVVLADSVDLPESVDRSRFAAERPNLEKTLQTSSLYEGETALAAQKLRRIEAIDRLLS